MRGSIALETRGAHLWIREPDHPLRPWSAHDERTDFVIDLEEPREEPPPRVFRLRRAWTGR